MLARCVHFFGASQILRRDEMIREYIITLSQLLSRGKTLAYHALYCFDQ